MPSRSNPDNHTKAAPPAAHQVPDRTAEAPSSPAPSEVAPWQPTPRWPSPPLRDRAQAPAPAAPERAGHARWAGGARLSRRPAVRRVRQSFDPFKRKSGLVCHPERKSRDLLLTPRLRKGRNSKRCLGCARHDRTGSKPNAGYTGGTVGAGVPRRVSSSPSSRIPRPYRGKRWSRRRGAPSDRWITGRRSEIGDQRSESRTLKRGKLNSSSPRAAAS